MRAAAAKWQTGETIMDVPKMIAELQAQLQQINEAILTLERLAQGSTAKRRGRPPKWISEVRSELSPEPAAPAKRGRPSKRTLTPEARARMAEAQKRRWAAAQASQSGESSEPASE